MLNRKPVTEPRQRLGLRFPVTPGLGLSDAHLPEGKVLVCGIFLRAIERFNQSAFLRLLSGHGRFSPYVRLPI
jgi:hypothetical protein